MVTVGSSRNVQTRDDVAGILSILSVAMRQGSFPLDDRICAVANSQSPEEGLALLGAYVAISDTKVRQAILDAVLTIAARR